MRWFPLVVVVVVGCSKKSEDAPKPEPVKPAAKPADAAVVAKPASCFGAAMTGMLTGFTADDKTATVCAEFHDSGNGDKPAVKKCMAVDLATGVYSDAKPPAEPMEAFEYKYADGVASACANGKCVALDVPKLPTNDPPLHYTIHASDDGKRLLVVGGNGDLAGIAIVDAATGKTTKVIKFGNPQSDCLEQAYFVGDAIYAMTSVCAGPGGTGHLLHEDGKPFAKIDNVNMFSAVPVRLDGDLWAFADADGGAVTVWDVKAGKEVRTVKLEGEPCADCQLFDMPLFDVPTLVKQPSGKLVTIYTQGVQVVDPQTGTAGKLAPFPICKPPT